MTSYSITPFAGYTGVEPAPYAVTGRHLNRLTYTLNVIVLSAGLAPATYCVKTDALNIAPREYVVAGVGLEPTSAAYETAL